MYGRRMIRMIEKRGGSGSMLAGDRENGWLVWRMDDT